MPRAAPVALTALVLASAPVLAACGGADREGAAATTAPPATTPRETTMTRPAEPVWCPGGKGIRTSERFDARVLLGLPTAEATARARREGCALRVVRRDGQDLVRTMDLSTTRVNVTEEDGRVVRIDFVG